MLICNRCKQAGKVHGSLRIGVARNCFPEDDDDVFVGRIIYGTQADLCLPCARVVADAAIAAMDASEGGCTYAIPPRRRWWRWMVIGLLAAIVGIGGALGADWIVRLVMVARAGR